MTSDLLVFGMTVFDFLDFLTAKFMLPMGGFLVALFVGWYLTRQMTEDELSLRSSLIYRIWRFVIRYVSPAAVAVIFAVNLYHKLAA